VPRFVFSLLAQVNGTYAEIDAFMRDHQLGLLETLERVRRDRLSLARFGDGELLLAERPNSAIAFQRGSAELQAELRQILSGDGYDSVPLLVCIPGMPAASSYWRQYWAKYWARVKPMLNLARQYGISSVSRESLFRLDAEAGRLAWRAIWDGRDVCFVVGEGSRFDAIDALFGNAASQRTVYSLPRDAYADLPRLIAEIERTVPRDTLILASLGPAATVLAARLARLGYWAIDLGHITSAWRTVVEGAPRAEKTPLLTAR
jgi:hypothetical protein